MRLLAILKLEFFMSDFDKSVKKGGYKFFIRPIETEKFSGSVDPEIPAKHLLIKIIVSKWAICQAAFIRRRGVLNRKLRAHVTALEFCEYCINFWFFF